MASPVRLIFLGGIAEVGRNMFLLEHGADVIVVDCGIGFPHEEQLGIDLILPDIGYLRERAERVRAIFITHGHEDHIGALSYLLPDMPAPVYGTKLALGLISVKLEEAGLLARSELLEFDPDGDVAIEAGVFRVEPFRVCHSIPDSVGFGITTPAGLIVHTGDFKLDPTPIDGRRTDFGKLARFRERGVRLLVSDCVHVEAPGRTPSEAVVGETYGKIFGEAQGRIFIATFASLIARIQQVIDVAAMYGRKVATLGRSLENNVRIALELGYLSDPERVLIESREAAALPDEKVAYVVTGSPPPAPSSTSPATPAATSWARCWSC
jgi:ribonuclease J